MKLRVELVHLLPQDWDDHNKVFTGKPVWGICGEQATILRGNNQEYILLALPMEMFKDCENLVVTGIGVDKVEPCPHCMAHPDYPLLLLGVA